MAVAPFSKPQAPKPQVAQKSEIDTRLETMLESFEPISIKWMGQEYKGSIRVLGWSEEVRVYSLANDYLEGETWATAHFYLTHIAICRATCEVMWPDAPSWLKWAFIHDHRLTSELYERIGRYRDTRFQHSYRKDNGEEVKVGFQVVSGLDSEAAAVPDQPAAT